MTKVLVVDDSATMRRYISLILRSAGHEVIEVEGAAECLAVLESMSVDVVVTDLNMPGMSGMELVARLASGGASTARIVVCSAAVDDMEAEERGRLEEVAVVLSKPFQPRDLLNKLA